MEYDALRPPLFSNNDAIKQVWKDDVWSRPIHCTTFLKHVWNYSKHDTNKQICCITIFKQFRLKDNASKKKLLVDVSFLRPAMPRG